MPRHISAPPRRRLAARPHAAAAPITTSPRLGGASRPLAVASLAAAAPCPCCPSLRHASAFQIQTVPCRREPMPCSARPMLRRATPSLDCPPPEHAPADRCAAFGPTVLRLAVAHQCCALTARCRSTPLPDEPLLLRALPLRRRTEPCLRFAFRPKTAPDHRHASPIHARAAQRLPSPTLC